MAACTSARYHNHFCRWCGNSECIRKVITVDFIKSRASTSGNEPIFPEIVLAIGLRFVGLGSTVADLADVYGVSEPSVKRCINMFLNAVDYNTDIPELQVSLPDPTDNDALQSIADGWAACSTAWNLFNNNLAAIDGWLPRTQAPDVVNQADYFSGHYQCYGLNIQAMCDADLIFLYIAVAAPGKTNDLRAFNLVRRLIRPLLVRLENVPEIFTLEIFTLEIRKFLL